MADIEARIAELFNPKITTSNQVITQKDVEDMIGVMGRPEQFAGDSGEAETTGSAAPSQARTQRRLFRDPDSRILGGVASGLASYVGTDPVWIRLLFVVMFFLGLGGFFLYIILWIVIPEAKTAAQKLQMKGAAVNFESIGKTFEEAGSRFQEKMSGPEVKSFGARMERFFQSFFHVTGVIVSGVIKALAKIIGVVIIIAGVVLAFLVIGLLDEDLTIYAMSAEEFFSFGARELMLSIFNSEAQYLWARIGAIALLGIPVIGIIYGGLRLVFNIRGHSGIGAGLGILWILSFLLCLYLGIKVGSDFRSESSVTERKNLESTFGEYVLTMSSEDVPGSEIVSNGDGDFLLHIDKSHIYFGKPRLNIERSYTDSLQLRIVKTAMGPSSNKAKETAADIEYSVDQGGELISFKPYMTIDRKHKLRAQEVRITLLLPEGRSVYLDESLRDIIHDIDNVTDTWDDDMLGKKWIMLDKGLTCLDCTDIEGVSSAEVGR